MDEALKKYQLDLARAQISRRRFMTGAAMASVATLLAACAPTGAASVAPSVAPPPSTGPSAGGGGARASTPPASAAPTPAPSYELESSMLLYNWSDYFSPDNLAAFKKDAGVTINQTTFASNEEMLAKLKAGGKGQYDVAVPTAEFSATLAAD